MGNLNRKTYSHFKGHARPKKRIELIQPQEEACLC